MRFMISILASATVALAAIGCDDTTGVSVDDLEGTWNASTFEYINQANSSERVDLIPLGATFTLTVSQPDAVSTVFDFDGNTDSDSNNFTISGDTLFTNGDTFIVDLSGDLLVLTNNDEAYDFNEDGSDEPATLRIVLERQ